jgi:hypothetical protein
MTDRTTKALLAAIALGLWMNVASDWFRPVALHAQDDTRIVRELRNVVASIDSLSTAASNIDSNVDSLERVARGVCSNSKIC